MKQVLFALFICLSLFACTPGAQVTTAAYMPFQGFVDSAVNNSNPGAMVHVESHEKKISWNGVAGVSEKNTDEKILPNQTFRIASVTKTFVACTILRLFEEGKLKLDDAIGSYISEKHNQLLKRGGYDTDKITIRHLLTHSGGLFDHTRAPVYFETIFKDSSFKWTRTRQLEIAVQHGKPVGEPGKQFSYSDTGYILLGEIIERLLGTTLNEGIVRMLRLKKLGIVHTFIEGEPNTAGKRIHQYYNGTDTYHFDPSVDLFGGGGLLSTTTDLARFFLHLFSNKVFRKPSTLKLMLEKVNYDKPQAMDYRMGIYVIKINDMEAYTHTGFWGTQVVYVPTLKTAIAANYSQIWKTKGTPAAPVITKIVTELASAR